MNKKIFFKCLIFSLSLTFIFLLAKSYIPLLISNSNANRTLSISSSVLSPLIFISINRISSIGTLYFSDKNFISLKFKIDNSVSRFPYKLRIPIELNLYQYNDIPVAFLLHLIDGYIDELEIYTMDGSTIDYNEFNFCIEKHIINNRLEIKQ